MHGDPAPSRDGSAGDRLPAVNPPDAAPRGPLVVDAEFRVLPPVPRLWRLCREYGWALGPYLAYCAALWGLAALIGWVL